MSNETKHVTWTRGAISIGPSKMEVGCSACGWRTTRRTGAAAFKAAMAHEANPEPPQVNEDLASVIGCLVVLFLVGLLVAAVVTR